MNLVHLFFAMFAHDLDERQDRLSSGGANASDWRCESCRRRAARRKLCNQLSEATISAMLAVGSKPGGPFKRVDKGTYTLADASTPPATGGGTRKRDAKPPTQRRAAKPRTQKPQTSKRASCASSSARAAATELHASLGDVPRQVVDS
jgi:hypothetical protein